MNEQSMMGDREAIALLEEAQAVLKDFYDKMELVQMSRHRALLLGRRMPAPAAGEAPPPPPATWEEPYGGAKQENSGIQTLLTFIIEDLQKDVAKVEQEEEEAQKEFKKQVAELTEAMRDAEDAIVDLSAHKAALEGLMSTLKKLQPGCDWLGLNFDERVKQRNAE